MSNKVRLIKKTSRTFLLTGLVLAVLSTIALFFYTKYQLENELEEVLYSTEARVENALKSGKTVGSLPPILEVNEVKSLKDRVLKDTVIYDPSQQEMELFREYSNYRKINGKNYQITIREMVVESEDFLIAIVLSNVIIFGLAFVFLFYFNTSRNLQLWQPFFKNLEQMKRFSLSSKAPLELVESDVLEFSELKNEITTLTNKVRADYENLKQFTEDVSHEMQTPLAIIQAKLDNIINSQEINEVQFIQITSIQKDIQKLKQLNKRITILTKIDNNQFVTVENVNLTEIINNKVESFKELKMSKMLHASNDMLNITMDPYLAEILINNLISNAIKYNNSEEVITIVSDKSSFVISNFGEKALEHPSKLFQRFYRESNETKSTGLGLAIVKKICDLYQFKVSYKFDKMHHIFSVNFSTK
ncbi:sensor histidine kinase [Winogradskyella sp.]|uniref:sensor histidine kinase n=1 Tax=Winogradskyella sp. TaxID=1883156 RepID=UPI00261D6D9C|nr:HAMP domain-containing sensor histidine kinase [uncultured Winogradskyella sp.]